MRKNNLLQFFLKNPLKIFGKERGNKQLCLFYLYFNFQIIKKEGGSIMCMRTVLIALIVMLLIVIGTPALSQEAPPDLTGTWVSKFTGTCYDPIEGRTQERGQDWTIYIDDPGDGTFNAMIPNISETVYFGKVISDPKDPDKGAVVFIKCNINDALTVNRSALAWGEFDVNSKKATLDVTVVGYFVGSNPDIWEVCDYHDQYVRVTSDIPSVIDPCQSP